MPSTKPTQRKTLTPRQQVALEIAAAIWSGLSWEILEASDGELSRRIKQHAFEFADVFLADEF